MHSRQLRRLLHAFRASFACPGIGLLYPHLYPHFVSPPFISGVSHPPVDTGHPYLLLGDPTRDFLRLWRLGLWAYAHLDCDDE